MYQIKKSIITAFTLALLLNITSCGFQSSSDGTSEDTGSITINGKAIDGYLKYSTICLDLNNDGFCQNDEPTAKTEEDGSFSLTASSEQQEHPNFTTADLVVFGGQDSDTLDFFSGMIKAPFDSNAEETFMTPVSTMIAEVKRAGGSLEDAKIKVANLLGVEAEDLEKDPVAEAKTGKPELLRAAIQLQKMVDVMASAAKEEGELQRNVSQNILSKLAEALSTSEVNTSAKASDRIAAMITSAKDELPLKAQAASSAAVVVAKNAETAFEAMKSSKGEDNNFSISDIQAFSLTVNKVKKAVQTEVADKFDDINFTDVNNTALGDALVLDINESVALEADFLVLDESDILKEQAKNEVFAVKVELTEKAIELSNASPSEKTAIQTAIEIRQAEIESLLVKLSEGNFTELVSDLGTYQEKIELEDLQSSTDSGITFTLPYTWNEIRLKSNIQGQGSGLYVNKVVITADGNVTETEFGIIASSGVTVTPSEEGKEIRLVNGAWTLLDKSGSSAILSADAQSLYSSLYNSDLTIKKEDDLSGEKIFVPAVGTEVLFSTGASRTYLASRLKDDTCSLKDSVQDWNGDTMASLQEYSEFVAADGVYMDLVPTELVEGVSVIINPENADKFYGVYDGVVYSGHCEDADESFRMFERPVYNDIALEDMQEAIRVALIAEKTYFTSFFTDILGAPPSNLDDILPAINFKRDMDNIIHFLKQDYHNDVANQLKAIQDQNFEDALREREEQARIYSGSGIQMDLPFKYYTYGIYYNKYTGQTDLEINGLELSSDYDSHALNKGSVVDVQLKYDLESDSFIPQTPYKIYRRDYDLSSSIGTEARFFKADGTPSFFNANSENGIDETDRTHAHISVDFHDTVEMKIVSEKSIAGVTKNLDIGNVTFSSGAKEISVAYKKPVQYIMTPEVILDYLHGDINYEDTGPFIREHSANNPFSDNSLGQKISFNMGVHSGFIPGSEGTLNALDPITLEIIGDGTAGKFNVIRFGDDMAIIVDIYNSIDGKKEMFVMNSGALHRGYVNDAMDNFMIESRVGYNTIAIEDIKAKIDQVADSLLMPADASADDNPIQAQIDQLTTQRNSLVEQMFAATPENQQAFIDQIDAIDVQLAELYSQLP